jgi:acyl-CoA synthetase (AMP-forming)/AMP-acid ligase II
MARGGPQVRDARALVPVLQARAGTADHGHNHGFSCTRVSPRVTEAELSAWAKERLAAYKYPRVVQYVDALPLTPTGKILKRELA